MNKHHLMQILEKFEKQELSRDDLANQILGEARIDGATVDLDRASRTGTPETIFGQGKNIQQLIDISTEITKQQQTVLITRINAEKGAALQSHFSTGSWNTLGNTFLLNPPKITHQQEIAIICAGTSDLYVAHEAKETLLSMGHEPTIFSDIGVAGIHRLFNRLEEIRKFKVLIVIAGMEGALTSVIAGLVNRPVIGVPTSVGYGSHLQGLTPLLGMLNSCAPGVVVCNIDNGYGAAMAAFRMILAHHE